MVDGPAYQQPHLAVPHIERLHRTIELLRIAAPRSVTGEALASELGVSVRSVERDIARLAAAGVPIEGRRGVGGGYAMAGPHRSTAVALSPGELAALVVSLAAWALTTRPPQHPRSRSCWPP